MAQLAHLPGAQATNAALSAAVGTKLPLMLYRIPGIGLIKVVNRPPGWAIVAGMGRQHILEPAAQEIADATSRLPPVDELGPDGLRKALDDIQAAPIAAPEVDERWITVAAEVGQVRVRIVKPVGSAAPLPSVLYIHGGGWVRGNPLRGTAAATAAIEQAIHVLRQAFAMRS